MSRYINMIEKNELVRVQQGHADIDSSHSESMMSHEDALVVVNRYNIQEFHPDVYVVTPDHMQVTTERSEIIGFVLREDT